MVHRYCLLFALTCNENKSSKQPIPVTTSLNSFCCCSVTFVLILLSAFRHLPGRKSFILLLLLSVINTLVLSLQIPSIFVLHCDCASPYCCTSTTCLPFTNLLTWMFLCLLCCNLLIRHLILLCVTCLTMPGHFLELQIICRIHSFFLCLIVILQISNLFYNKC